MKERIEQIKALYKVAEDFRNTMGIVSNAISPMKAQLSDEIQAIDDRFFETIVSCAFNDQSAQPLTDKLVRKQQLEMTLKVLSEEEKEIYSSIGYKVMGKLRIAESRLNELYYELILGEIEIDKVELLLTEMGEYLKPDKVECLNKELLEKVSD